MKKIILLFVIPFTLFGQSPSEPSNFIKNDEINQVIHFKPSSLLFGTLSLSYERKFLNKHSIYLGVPMYFKRDITNSKIIRTISPAGDSLLYDYESVTNSTVNDILDDVYGLSYLSGVGLNFGYKYYFGKESQNLSGFYINPEFSSFAFNIKANANKADINFLISDNYYPDLFDEWNLDNLFEYDLDAKLSRRLISINIGHQWIKNWFSIDMKLGIGNYALKYEYDERRTYNNQDVELNKDKGESNLWLPNFSTTLGVAF